MWRLRRNFGSLKLLELYGSVQACKRIDFIAKYITEMYSYLVPSF